MIFSLATKKVQLSVPVIERSKPKSRPDQRKEIEGAKTIEKEKEAAWKRLILIKTIRAKQKRRMLKKVNDEILREALDDSTVTSGLSVPKTLEEALPDDIEKRNNDPRAIVVTEASGSFNMIGCNKAWEVRLLATDLQWRCSYYIQSITSKCIFLKESLWIYRV
jgi:hypothetical protein